MRKVLLLALLCALVGLPLFAGGQNEKAAAPEGPVTIKYMSYEPNLDAEQKRIIELFEKENPMIKVELEYPAPNITAYNQKTDTMILAGEPMDVVVTTIKHGMAQRAEDGMYHALDEFFKRDGTTYDTEYVIDGAVKNDHYAVPLDVKHWVTLLNKSALTETGLAVPALNWTWADYRTYAAKLTKGEGQSRRYGSFMMNRWEHFFNAGVYSVKRGNPYFDAQNNFDVSDPQFRAFLEYRNQLENVDKSQVPTAEVLSQDMWTNDAFFNARGAMTFMGTWMFADIKNVEKWPHDFVTTFAALPRAGSNEGWTYTENRWWSVVNNSKHPYEAYKFIRFYSNEGMKIKGAGFSAVRKNPAKDVVVDIMSGNNASGMYDVAALKAVMLNPKWFDNDWIYSPPISGEIGGLRVETANEYLTGGKSLDEAQKKFDTEGRKAWERWKSEK